MAKKSEEKIETTQGMNNIINTWTSESNEFLRVWEESNLRLYQPLVDFVKEESVIMTDLSMKATPKQYKEFYDNWMKNYKNSFGKIYPTPISSPKEALEDIIECANESNKVYLSWVEEFEKNSKKTSEVLNNGVDLAKYRDCYESWLKTYEKISNDITDNPAIRYQKKIFSNYTGVADFNPELFSKMFDPQTMKPSKEILDSLKESTEINLNLFKSWTAALEKMSEKLHDQSKLLNDPDAFKELYNLWIKMYEKSSEDIFEGIPLVSPLKEMMEPVKSACKIYTNTSIKMSRMWMDSFNRMSQAQKS